MYSSTAYLGVEKQSLVLLSLNFLKTKKRSLTQILILFISFSYFSSRKACAGPVGSQKKSKNEKRLKIAKRPQKNQKSKVRKKTIVQKSPTKKNPVQKNRDRWFGDDFPLKNALHLLPDISVKEQKKIWSFVRSAQLSKAQKSIQEKAKKLKSYRKDRLLLRWSHQLMSLGESKKALTSYRKLFTSKHAKIALIALIMSARDLYTQRRYIETLRVLKMLPKISAKNSLDRYLSAGLLLKASALGRLKRYSKANQYLGMLIARKSLIADYAFYLKIMYLYQSHRYTQLSKNVSTFSKRFPRNRFVLRVQYLAARSFEARKKFATAQKRYKALLTKKLPTRGSFSKSALWLRIAYCKAKGSFTTMSRKDKAATKSLFIRILKKVPGSRTADRAYLIWKRTFTKKLTFSERYLLSYHLYRRGRLEQAERGFHKLLLDGKKQLAAKKKAKKKAKTTKISFDLIAKSGYYHGYILFRLKRYKEASKTFLWTKRHFANHRLGRSAYFYWTRSNYRQKKNVGAVAEYLKFWSRNKRNSHGKKTLWYASQMMMEHGHFKKAVQLFRKHRRLYPRDRWGREVPIKLALIFYQQKKYKKVIRELQKSATKSSRLAARAWFWIGKSHEKLKKKSKAKKAFQRISKFSDPYYWARAQKRLTGRSFFARKHVSLYRLLPDDREEAKSERKIEAWYKRYYGKKRSITSVSNQLKRSNNARRAYIFALAGRFSAARFDFKMLRRRWRQPIVDYFLARAWLAFGRANRTIRRGSLFRSRISGKRKGFPSLVLRRLLFPIPFPALYMRFGKKYNVRPLLFLSLTRQESVFDAAAVSGVGAIGIAQIMPKEAVLIAKKWSLKGYTQNWLYRPQLNLKMGIYHFHSYLEKHGNVIELTLAAYNAGPHSLKRWVALDPKLPKRDLEAFVAYGIGYRETRRYVPACLRWYTSYRLLQ